MFIACLKRIGRGLTVLLLALAGYALARSLIAIPLEFSRTATVIPGSLGFAGGILVFALICRFLPLYIFGHEFTHWLVAKLFRRRTGALSVRRDSGSIEVEKPNIWITLAPYIVPLYALLWLLFVAIPVFLWPELTRHPAFVRTASAMTGFTYAYHFVLTLEALLRGQEDVVSNGPVLSLTLIVCGNLAFLYVGLLTASHQWPEGLAMLRFHVTEQWRFFLTLFPNLLP